MAPCGKHLSTNSINVVTGEILVSFVHTQVLIKGSQ